MADAILSVRKTGAVHRELLPPAELAAGGGGLIRVNRPAAQRSNMADALRCDAVRSSRCRPHSDPDGGVLLIGDAAGLAYPQSGEGIRPAVESGLMAAQVILEAAGNYRHRRLEPYASRLADRFGSRNPRQRSASWLPQKFRQNIAARLMATRSFARHVVIDRWFLRTGQHAVPVRWPS